MEESAKLKREDYGRLGEKPMVQIPLGAVNFLAERPSVTIDIAFTFWSLQKLSKDFF
jgi:hypothetical protein